MLHSYIQETSGPKTKSFEKAIDSGKSLQQTLQSYYESWESYFGYEVMLGGAQHYGYYDKDTYWPFAIGRSLQQMQAKMLSLLGLPTGSKILEAGCGLARVALYMAQQGMRVTAVDILDQHVTKSRRNVAKAGLLQGQVTVEKMDYHHLELIPSESHDGVYTLQALGHATHLELALAGFRRILKPGGRIALIEAERRRDHEGERTGDELSKQLKRVNEYVGYPTNELSREGYFKELLENAGFVDVEVFDYSENILPMLRMCYVMMIVPFFFVQLFGIEKHFITGLAVTCGYLGRDRWRFVGISATKPGAKIR